MSGCGHHSAAVLLAAGKPREPVAALTGTGRYRHAEGNRFGLLGTAAQGFVTSLPQVRLGSGFAGRLYQGTPQYPTLLARDRWDELLWSLGVPYGRLAPREAVNR